MNDKPGSEYFDSSEFSIRVSIEDNHYWHIHRRQVLLETLRAFALPESAGRLLEIGCGIGTVTTHLNDNGYCVDYGDFFEDAIAIARERATRRLGSKLVSDRRFVRIDATQPLDLAAYGGVLLLDVIEHLPDDELVLANVRRGFGSAGGFVLVTVPAFDFLWSPWDDVEKHKRRYTQQQLVSVLERAGFEVAHTTYLFAPLFFAALGMKGVRKITSAFTAQKAGGITELAESTNVDVLNRIVLGAHRPERRWLARGKRLPFGTSVLAIARCR